MVETAGHKLRRARQMRQLGLEDVARATKIRESQLADLEGDDYSNFANLAYARSYLVNYGKFLRVDMRPYLEAFSDASTFGLDDYQYLSEKPVGMYRIPYRRIRRTARASRRQLIGGALTLAVVAVGLYAWMLSVNIRRLGNPDQIAARLAAHEKAVREAVSGVAAPVAIPETARNVDVNHAAPEAPGAASGELIPVSAPVGAPPASAPNTADTPAPNVAPVPAEAPTQEAIPALATADASRKASPSDGTANQPSSLVRELLTAHNSSQPQPQKVVNDRPRGQ